MATRLRHYFPKIELVSDAFEIPQLKKFRRIWALLPHDYHLSTKNYPVLYLHDAQNLFNENSPFGSWRIDKRLGELSAHGFNDIIVIAIDHGGKERIKEYSPYFHRKFGKGTGELYSEFIIDSLKPYIDKNYRTKSGREYSGIGGSSMGGLISAYIGLIHPEHFSKMMIFSPSFWFSDEIYFDAFNRDYTKHLDIYLYAGEKESTYMTQHLKKFRRAVESGEIFGGKNDIKISINPEGRHQEKYWSKAFPDAIEWLFFRNKEIKQ